MQTSINNNDDTHKMNDTQVNSIVPSIANNSIRFACPQRPPQQDYSPIRPYRTTTYNSIQSNASRYHDHQRRPIKHHYSQSSLVNAPFFLAAFLSLVGTFMSVRALVIRGYLVDHSTWDGKGHHYDQNPLVFLNTAEVLLMILSLLCGLCVCALLVWKTRIYQNSVSSYCIIGALIQATCSLTTAFLFYERTLDLVGTLNHLVYSRGFYSCVISGTVMLLAMLGFFLDWLLDSFTDGPLVVVLNAMFLPSVMYCCILNVGVLIFMWIENWEYSQAMMFCATALTTIGYGDVAPVSPLGRLVFLVYATFGICVVGYFLLSLRAVMINGSSFNLMMKVNLVRMESLHDFARHQRQRERQRLHQRYGRDRDDLFTEHDIFNTANDDGDELPRMPTYEPPRPQRLARHRSADVISTFSNYTLANILNEENRQMWVHVITHSGVWRMSVIFCLTWFGGAAVFCLLEENWTYLDALYFAFATQLTIGFGDLVPQTMIAQEFWFVYIIISIAVAAYFICLFGDVLAEKLLIDGESDNASETIDDHSNNGGDDYNGYEFNRYHGTGEMVEGNDLNKNDQTPLNPSQELLTNRVNFDVNATTKPVSNEFSHYPHQENAGTSTWAIPISQQENTLYNDVSPHHISLSRRLHTSTPSQQLQQDRFIRHQPLQHRTNSLPIISIDQYQRRQTTYGTLPQNYGNRAFAHNKKSKRKMKTSKYLPVAVTGNTQRLPLQ